MKIYSEVTKFNTRTGKPYSSFEKKEVRCDFTGVVIDSDYASPYPTYKLDYGDSDPCFASDGDAFEFGKIHGIDMYQLMSDEYVFDNGDNGLKTDACALMIKKFSRGKGHMTFADMCRYARLETAKKLIKDGIITADQLPRS